MSPPNWRLDPDLRGDGVITLGTSRTALSGEKVISHMDGRLGSLKGLIGKAKLDAIEAFTPPPMGNLPSSPLPGKGI